MKEFKSFWKAVYTKETLTPGEIKNIQNIIYRSEITNQPASKTIKMLQRYNPKLRERYKAERVYWTESKKMGTESTLESSNVLDVFKFRIIPSPTCCDLCHEIAKNGNRIFVKSELFYKGQKIPPIHPNCLCTLVPVFD